MKKFCESLREYAIKIINFKNKKTKFLTKKQQKSNENAKVYYICNEDFEHEYCKDEKYSKVRNHCQNTVDYKDATHSIFIFKK